MLERYGRNGGHVHREGCGIPQNGTPRDTVHLQRLPPPASTGYCSSTVDLLQPPPTTVHPRAPVHPASTVRYSTGYCSTTRLHGVLLIHPSNGYCSSTPPPSTVHPALHTTGSCSSRGNATAHCSSKPPCNAHCSSQRQHRSASVSSSSEGIARSGSVNSHRSIARVQ